MNAQYSKTRRLTLLAMLSALAYVVMVVGRIPIVMFLRYDPKDVIITFAGLLFGPLSSLVISVLVSVVEMFTVSDTGPIGCIMNIVATCCFACTAAWIYRRRRTLGGAVLGLVAGTLLMTAAMLLWNYWLTPLYLGYPRAAVADMLVPIFLPFNLFKGGLNAALTLLLYKPALRGLRRAHLIETTEPPQSSRLHLAGMLGAVAGLVAVCIVLLLVLKGLL